LLNCGGNPHPVPKKLLSPMFPADMALFLPFN
jgi:hypothetical protein